MFVKLQGDHVNLIALGLDGAAFVAAYKAHISLADSHLWVWLLLVSIGLSIFAALFNFWRLQKITEAPISTIAAAAQGYIELHGVATSTKPLHTPYHGIPCVWYRAWVFANRYDKAHSKNPIDHRLLEYAESDEIFQLKDATGTCSVNPKGAEIIFFKKQTFYKNDHRYVEEYLPAGKYLYVLGQLDTRHDHLEDKAIHQEVGKILADMKAHPDKLLNRFDHNRNGQIDLDEWELARQDAIHQAQAKQAMKAHTGDFTLAKPTDQHLFLISSKAPQTLSASYRYWAIVHLGLLILLLIVFAQLT